MEPMLPAYLFPRRPSRGRARLRAGGRRVALYVPAAKLPVELGQQALGGAQSPCVLYEFGEPGQGDLLEPDEHCGIPVEVWVVKKASGPSAISAALTPSSATRTPSTGSDSAGASSSRGLTGQPGAADGPTRTPAGAPARTGARRRRHVRPYRVARRPSAGRHPRWPSQQCDTDPRRRRRPKLTAGSHRPPVGT